MGETGAATASPSAHLMARQIAAASGRKVDVLAHRDGVLVAVVRMPRLLMDTLGPPSRPDARETWARVRGWPEILAGLDEAEKHRINAMVSWNGAALEEDREMAKGSKKGGGRKC